MRAYHFLSTSAAAAAEWHESGVEPSCFALSLFSRGFLGAVDVNRQLVERIRSDAPQRLERKKEPFN